MSRRVGDLLLERIQRADSIRLEPARTFGDGQGRRLVRRAVRRQSVPSERYWLRATVKRHDSERNETVPVLTRCRSEWLQHERGAPVG